MAKHQRLSASGKLERNPERFYCPYPNCTRSFAELWRLKVHYRAPPDARGSGKERGHGCELQQCPKCEKELKQGRHHVGCFANKGGNTKKRPQKVAEEPFADPEDFVGIDRRQSTPAPNLARPPSGFRPDHKPPAPTHGHPYHQAPRPMSTAMSEPLQPVQMKRKLPEEFAQRTRPIPDYELHGSIHAAGSFLMGARANTLPPPSAFELSGQPEPIFERFSSSSEDTPAAHEQRPGSAPELNQFGTLFDDEESWAGLMMAQVELQGADFLLPESFGLPGDSLALPVAPAQEPAKPQTASIYNIQANCSTETFQDRKMDISSLLNVADDFPDVPHSLLGDMASSLAPMHHRRAASCTVPQRSSADENIMMQGTIEVAYGMAHGSPVQQPQHHPLHQQQQQQPQQQYQQQQQAQQHALALAPSRNAARPLEFLRYCSRAAPPLPTIHSFPSLEGYTFSSDDSPVRTTHGRYTSSSASSEYEDAELVHTEKASVSRKGEVYEFDIFSVLEPSVVASFDCEPMCMMGHSPQTPQEMYPSAKGGNAAARWSPQSEQTHAHGGC